MCLFHKKYEAQYICLLTDSSWKFEKKKCLLETNINDIKTIISNSKYLIANVKVKLVIDDCVKSSNTTI